ncbi:LysE family translocator [Dongia sedimenti]|uniref:LysE family translocator n=1 Tax=Dongia sedimenti TaxID=3064282 RepID=A0ABU0YFI1_9PROT|nr:LysE family translocator [Rhodospirillaceae bacterium R-7]
MISFHLWLAFAAAAAVVIAIPGPTTLMVTGHAMSSGTRVALASLLGVALGDFTAIACSVLGLGAVLAASAEAFTVLKWVGAAYLIYLGIRLWRAPAVPLGTAAAGRDGRRSMRRAIAQSFSVTVLNPKGLLFFAAFLPQFIDPHRAVLPQVVVLALTFEVLAAGSLALYVFMMARARRLMESPRAIKIMNRAGGTMLIGAGLLTASLRRS